jgi:hypothetical protein
MKFKNLGSKKGHNIVENLNNIILSYFDSIIGNHIIDSLESMNDDQKKFQSFIMDSNITDKNFNFIIDDNFTINRIFSFKSNDRGAITQFLLTFKFNNLEYRKEQLDKIEGKIEGFLKRSESEIEEENIVDSDKIVIKLKQIFKPFANSFKELNLASSNIYSDFDTEPVMKKGKIVYGEDGKTIIHLG